MDRSLSTRLSALRGRAEGAIAGATLALPDRAVRGLAGRAVCRDGLALDPEAQLLIGLMALIPEPELSALSVDRARARNRRNALSLAGSPTPVADVRPHTITGDHAVLGARLYTPGPAEPEGLLVYFHGGGFVTCDLDTHDAPCRLLADAAGVRVLSVDYRMGPEHPFPAAHEDAWAAFTHAVGELGVAPSRIAVGGDSAGGNLAAGVAQRAVAEGGPAPAFQLLIYPWLDLAHKRRSYALFGGGGFYLSEADLDWFAARYAAAPGDVDDPRCSPMLAPDLAGVAPAYVATAGFDPLRDEGEEYARRLREAGVPAVARRHDGLFHGYANILGAGRRGRELVLQAASALRMGLALDAARPAVAK